MVGQSHAPEAQLLKRLRGRSHNQNQRAPSSTSTSVSDSTSSNSSSHTDTQPNINQASHSAQQQQRREDYISIYLNHFFKPVWRCPDGYVPKELLERLQITVIGIDFDTGQLSHTVKPLLVPMPRQKVEEILDKTQPWNCEKVKLDLIDSYYGQGPRGRWEEASMLGSVIRDFLGNSTTQTSLEMETDWYQFIPHASTFLNKTTDDYTYCSSVYTALQIDATPNTWTSTPDYNRPHIVCQTCESTPMVEGKILTGELRSILVLASSCARQEDAHNPSMVAVTVISTSNRDVRIVQGMVNLRKMWVDLRVSRIQSFESGIRDNWGKFLTLLGWFVGKVVQPPRRPD